MGNCLGGERQPKPDLYDDNENSISIDIRDIEVKPESLEVSDHCPICLDPFDSYISAITTACCRQPFHTKCLAEAVEATRYLCPLCKQVLSVPDSRTTVTCSFNVPVSAELRTKIVKMFPERLNQLRRENSD